MVDQKARRKYAELVRQFISGRMTNDEYEDRYEAIQQNKSDTAIGEIYHQLWFLYDDIQTHKMTGTHRLDREGRKTVAKTILFLQSDNEYQWPKDSMLGISLDTLACSDWCGVFNFNEPNASSLVADCCCCSSHRNFIHCSLWSS